MPATSLRTSQSEDILAGSLSEDILAAPLSEEILATIASGLASVTSPWQMPTGGVPTTRCYRQILSTAAYDAWVICWPAGVTLGLHDHGGSSGALCVVSGELHEETCGEGGVVDERSLGPGAVSSFGPAQVHGVSNRGHLPATSVHVYSPPLTSMTHYARDDGRLVAVAEEDGAAWDDARTPVLAGR